MGRRAYDLTGCEAVLSAGFAGACQPDLRPGDVLLAGAAPAALRHRLGALTGEIRTLDHIASPSEKSALGRQGVAAVDMETAWLAAAASVPFLSVRVIIDGLEDPAVSLATAGHYLVASCALRAAVAEAREFLSLRGGRG
jgi:nucleoside phosphorylase